MKPSRMRQADLSSCSFFPLSACISFSCSATPSDLVLDSPALLVDLPSSSCMITGCSASAGAFIQPRTRLLIFILPRPLSSGTPPCSLCHLYLFSMQTGRVRCDADFLFHAFQSQITMTPPKLALDDSYVICHVFETRASFISVAPRHCLFNLSSRLIQVMSRSYDRGKLIRAEIFCF